MLNENDHGRNACAHTNTLCFFGFIFTNHGYSVLTHSQPVECRSSRISSHRSCARSGLEHRTSLPICAAQSSTTGTATARSFGSTAAFVLQTCELFAQDDVDGREVDCTARAGTERERERQRERASEILLLQQYRCIVLHEHKHELNKFQCLCANFLLAFGNHARLIFARSTQVPQTQLHSH